MDLKDPFQFFPHLQRVANPETWPEKLNIEGERFKRCYVKVSCIRVNTEDMWTSQLIREAIACEFARV